MRNARVLIEAASGVVDWGVYRDTTAQELRALVEAKLQGQKAQQAGPVPALLPLLEALQQSVAAAQTAGAAAGRGKGRAARQRRRRTA